jgi:Zn-dependent metalloprotease
MKQFTVALQLSILLSTAAWSQIAEINLPQAEVDILAHDKANASPVWVDFLDDYSGSLIADWDTFHSFPHRVLGADIQLPGGKVTDAQDLDNRLREFMATNPGLLLPEMDSVKNLQEKHIARHGKLWFANYNQMVNGHPVIESDVVFRVSENGQLAMLGSDYFPEAIVDQPRLNRDDISSIARSIDSGEYQISDVVVDSDWVVLPILGTKNFNFKSAWPARIILDNPEQVYQVFLDGNTAEILWSWNTVRHVEVSGNLTGLVEDQQPSDPDLPLVMRELELSVDGNQVNTDENGYWSLDLNGEGPWTINGTLNGNFANVNRQDGPDANFSFEIAAGENNAFNIGMDIAQIQELDAYYHTTLVHDFITGLDDSFTGLNESLPVNININSTCNAYWDGSSINFFSEGGGCPNTARTAGVLYHEYGHGINDRQYAQAGENFGMVNGAMHEGLADVNCIYIQELNYVSPGWIIRDLDNNNSYPDDIIDQVHNDGLIVGGAMWDMWQNIGDIEHCRNLYHFARWGTPNDPNTGRTYFEYFIEIAIQDDDDADFSNSTPNWEAIDSAFNAHGIGSVLTWMESSFALDNVPFIQEPQIAISLNAQLDAPTYLVPLAVEVVYQINDNEEQVIELTLVGDEWQGELPGMDYGSVVSYYARVVNASNINLTDPPNAPETTYRTRVGYSEGMLQDFEHSAAATVISGVWERGLPVSGPDEAYSGTNVWATNLSGNYPDMHLATLELDQQVVLDDDFTLFWFWHWLDAEVDWDGVHVQMSVNNQPFELIVPISGYDFVSQSNNILPNSPGISGTTDSWERLVFDLTDLTEYGDEIRVQLSLFTDTNVNDSGWYIDDLQYLGFVAPPLIVHTPITDSEDAGQIDYPVIASLASTIPVDEFILRWRLSGEEETVLDMLESANPDEYMATIVGPFDEQTIEYRIEATNNVGYFTSFPLDENEWHPFHVGADSVAPSVSFASDPVNVIGNSATILFEANAIDNQNIASVHVFWSIDEGWNELAELPLLENNIYAASVYFNLLEGHDVRFKLRAIDTAGSANEAFSEEVAITMGLDQFLDDFESAELDKWNFSGTWTPQTQRVFEGEYSLGTSGTGFYQPNSSGILTFKQSFDLEYADSPVLSITDHVLMHAGDFVHIEVSIDDGESWDNLATRSSVANWEERLYPLDAWVGNSEVQIRFRMNADDVDNNPNVGYFVDRIRLVDLSVSIEANVNSTPAEFTLGHAYPNPFNPITRVEFNLHQAGFVEAAIYNLQGQLVQQLLAQDMQAGKHQLIVDGSAFASSIYMLKMQTAHEQQIVKLILMK